MRNLLTLLLLCCCLSPAFAQRNFLRGLTHWTRPAAFETNIKSAVLRTEAALKLPVSPHIRIANLPSEPLVKLGGVVGNAPAVSPARLLSGKESFEKIRLGTFGLDFVYVPLALNTGEEAVYRGLRLYDLESVKNILEHGLEYTRVSKKAENRIYFTSSLPRAVWFATRQFNSPESVIPVLVKFDIPDKNLVYARQSPLDKSSDYYYSMRNIHASFIKDVVVFLEVNGKPGWYKAMLKDGKLVLIPAPSEVFDTEHLIEHAPDIPKENYNLLYSHF